MSYTRNAIDIIESIVTAMTFKVKIKSVTVAAGLQTIEVCDLFHAEPNRNITIDGNSYLIKDIVESAYNECGVATLPKIILEGTPDIIATEFDLYAPQFYHGTPLAQNVNLDKKSNKMHDKTPMVWFLEQFRERYYDELNSNERDLHCSIFFLTGADHSRWLTEDAYHYANNPMKRLAENFISKLKSMVADFDTTEMEYELFYYSKFGVQITNQGTEKNFFHDELAGVELKLSPLTVRRREICVSC